MTVKIRLHREGKKKTPIYSIVVIDSRNSIYGKYIRKLGFINKLNMCNNYEIDREDLKYWLSKGAQPTKAMINFLKIKHII